MVNINEVRSICYKLATKQGTGFPSPDEFNLYANLANMDLFNYYNDLRRKSLLQVRTGISIIVPPALNPFVTIDQQVTVYSSNGTANANLPDNLSDLLSVATYPAHVNVSIIDYDKLNNTLNSTIDAPTTAKPAVLQLSGKVLVYPNNVNNLFISYLSFPATVTWAYTLTGNTPIYNLSGSVDFQWDATEKINLIMRILKYMGISIREAELINFAQQQEAAAN